MNIPTSKLDTLQIDLRTQKLVVTILIKFKLFMESNSVNIFAYVAGIFRKIMVHAVGVQTQDGLYSSGRSHPVFSSQQWSAQQQWI